MEAIKEILHNNRYIVYGIIGGIVVTFFDKDKIDLRTGVKLFVFGVLNEFSRKLLVGFEGLNHIDPLNNNQLMVASIVLSIGIYFTLIYIGDKTNRDKIITLLLSRFLSKK